MVEEDDLDTLQTLLNEETLEELDAKIERAKKAKNAAIAELSRLVRTKAAFTKRPEEIKKKRIRSITNEIIRLAPKIRNNDQAVVRLEYICNLSGGRLDRANLKTFIAENFKLTPAQIQEYVTKNLEKK